MTITAAELLVIGNERTSRAEVQADVDKFIKDWVNECAIRGLEIKRSEEVSFVTGTKSYDVSSYAFKKINVVTVEDSDNNEKDPLIEISWLEYKNELARNYSNSEPKKFCFYDGSIYVSPPPNATTYPLMNVSGDYLHADSTTIAYPDRYRFCASEFICFSIYKKYGMTDTKGKPHFELFIDAVGNLLSLQSAKRRQKYPQYNDI